MYLVIAFIFFVSSLFGNQEFIRKNPINERIYDEAAENNSLFWSNCAKKLSWFTPWKQINPNGFPYVKWFTGGRLNVCFNCLDRHLIERKDVPAIIWTNEIGKQRILTYKDLYNEVCKLANGLKSLGIKKGDFVAIYMPMVPEAVISMLACARIGAVHSVIFGGTGAGTLKEKLNDSQAKILITADGGFRRGKIVPYKEICEQILKEVSSIEHLIVVDHIKNSGPLEIENAIWYHDLTASMDSKCDPEWMDAEDPLFILYTSGTTGKAKGILQSNGGYLVGVYSTFQWVFDPDPTDIYWCTADVGWITGHSYVVYGPLSHGITQLIYEGSFDHPHKEIAWELIQKYKVTTFYTAPTLIRTFMKWGKGHLEKYDLSTLRLLGSIGEPLNPEAWQWYYSNIGQNRCYIVDTWFQTETGAFVIAPIPGLTRMKPGSVTRPLPGYEVEILDADGEKVNKGFLSITKPFPSLMRGILNDQDRYQSTYWSKWNGKYYYAGDAAELDDSGDIWVRGRADEVIIVSGHRIGTAELENVIIRHPKIAESAVIGIPDEIRGHAIVVIAVLKEGVQDTPELETEISNYIAEYQGTYARPIAVKFIIDLPKTKSGKILRRLLLQAIVGEEIGDITTIENQYTIPLIQNLGLVIQKQLTNK